MTVAPAWWNVCAICAPMPCDAPVISATLLVRSMAMLNDNLVGFVNRGLSFAAASVVPTFAAGADYA